MVGKFPNTVSGFIQWALYTIEVWCDELGLSVNPHKTGFVAFTRRKLPGFFKPRLFGTTLHRSMSVKYLGVILDSRLTWREHVDVREEGSKFVVGLQEGLWCDVGPETQGGSLAVRLYHQAITFASLVWWPGCQTASAKKKLSRNQRLACSGITGAMLTTPTNAVEALICLPPLELVVQSEARSAAHRLWSLGSWSYLRPNGGHSSVLMQLRQQDPIFNMGVDVMRPAFKLEPKYRVTMLMGEDWMKATGAPPAVKGLVWFTVGPR